MARIVKRRVWVPDLVDLTPSDLLVLDVALRAAIARSEDMAGQQSGIPVPAAEAITDGLSVAHRAVARSLLIDVNRLQKKLGRS